MTNAYSFIRFSSPAQMKGDSLRRQLAKAERFAAERGLDLDSTYRALGVSAFTGKHRVKGALAAFLNAVRTGEIAKGSWLLVENVDRLWTCNGFAPVT
ncbi:recombinase family protein [Novosphingobium sp.]|uniref:recombinase family protein n=1 Tax=Novosphingobium sp. TaxID=1874826 RepID=UPI0025E03B15|nr:recombinase family protein [Novosphingobium sp.]